MIEVKVIFIVAYYLIWLYFIIKLMRKKRD